RVPLRHRTYRLKLPRRPSKTGTSSRHALFQFDEVRDRAPHVDEFLPHDILVADPTERQDRILAKRNDYEFEPAISGHVDQIFRKFAGSVTSHTSKDIVRRVSMCLFREFGEKLFAVPECRLVLLPIQVKALLDLGIPQIQVLLSQ